MLISYHLEAIDDAAAQCLQLLSEQKILLFAGDLGAGKTTFIQALCTRMGVAERMSSPTFSIINEYTAKDGRCIYHMDLYRLRNEAEAVQAGVEDCLYSGAFCLVEWPERAPAIMPPNAVHLVLTIKTHNERILQINL